MKTEVGKVSGGESFAQQFALSATKSKPSDLIQAIEIDGKVSSPNGHTTIDDIPHLRWGANAFQDTFERNSKPQDMFGVTRQSPRFNQRSTRGEDAQSAYAGPALGLDGKVGNDNQFLRAFNQKVNRVQEGLIRAHLSRI